MLQLKKRWVALGLILLVLPGSALALVQINAMNYPAWVVRNHQTLPLSPGDQLGANDLLRTGVGGRLLLQMADGSAVKLGESARFVIQSTRLEAAQEQSLLESTFQVLRGAFRFTSAFFSQPSSGHRVDVRIGAITAGVRGTDIWGRSNAEQDLVCLIEGSIVVDTAGQDRLDMVEVLSFYVKPRDAAPLPLNQVEPERLQSWAAETELDPEYGIAAVDGQWQLVLLSLTDATRAKREMNKFRRQGYAVQQKTVIRQGRTLHRLLLPGFVSIEAAQNAGKRIAQTLGIRDAWVWRAA